MQKKTTNKVRSMKYEDLKTVSFLHTSDFRLHQGFTLVEMLVTMFIFSLIVGAVTNVFVSAIRAQRYNLAYYQLLDQTSYAMEYMARAIRMAEKDTNGICISIGQNYEPYSGVNDNIKFKTYDGKCREFFLVSNQLKVRLNTLVNQDSYYLTSPGFQVNNFRVSVFGDGAGDSLQPKVTVFMEIQGKGSAPQPKIRIQATISQRNLDIQ